MDSVTGSNGGEEVDEDQDESSSSSTSSNKSEPTNVLEEFRKEWKRELEQSPKLNTAGGQQSINNDLIPQNVEDKAKAYFQSGVECESAGKLYEAIQFYRRAVQLVPDIELRTFRQTDGRHVSGEDPLEEERFEEVENVEEEEESSYELGSDLLAHLLMTRAMRGKGAALCTPLLPTNMTHISDLPMEVFLYILSWVVSSELDLRSLEMCSRVCRGFYICARDQEIWRTACNRVWGVDCGSVGGLYLTWREMFIFRPRLCFGGCYISKTSYIRHGENSFQDQFYRPWHLVEYFRYLRFFPEGRVVSLVSSEEPMLAVGLLKSRVPPPRHPPLLVGYYRVVGSMVTVVLRPGPDKHRSKANSNQGQTSTFHLELEICSLKKRLHCQLVWRGYSVFTCRAGVETNTPFELQSARFPPFSFSRVKSYSAETSRPLCK